MADWYGLKPESSRDGHYPDPSFDLPSVDDGVSDDYALCAACRHGAHDQCRGASYMPPYTPFGQGCDCVNQHPEKHKL